MQGALLDRFFKFSYMIPKVQEEQTTSIT